MLPAYLGSTALLPPERPFRASSSGSLLGFLQPRSGDPVASVSSSFPSRRTLGGFPRSSGKVRSEPRQAAGKLECPRFPHASGIPVAVVSRPRRGGQFRRRGHSESRYDAGKLE